MEIEKQTKQEKIKSSIMSAIVGAILVMIIGFSWGGWVLGSTSLEMGEDMARNSVAERLAPICLAQFNQDTNRDEKLKEFKEIGSWGRGKFIKDQGWATIPFEKEPDSLVAEKCSVLLMKTE